MAAPDIVQSRTRTTVHWLSGGNIIAAIWLVIAPFALTYTDTNAALWNDIILGVGIGIVALIRVGMPLRYEMLSWLNALLGIWLIIAPFALGYSDLAEPLWNDIIVGAIVLVLAVWSAVTTSRVSQY